MPTALEAVETYLVPVYGRQIFEPFFRSDRGRQIFSHDGWYPYIARRTLLDYALVIGFTDEECREFADLRSVSAHLGRTVYVGDMGCGNGNVIKIFHQQEGVAAVGIDQRVTPFESENIRIIRGDFMNLHSQFWRHYTYDYLFCVLSAHLIPDIDLPYVIDIMKQGLSGNGTGYIVVPEHVELKDGRMYTFDEEQVSHLAMIDRTVDPVSGLHCVALRCYKQ